jgi:hypothetical protein
VCDGVGEELAHPGDPCHQQQGLYYHLEHSCPQNLTISYHIGYTALSKNKT